MEPQILEPQLLTENSWIGESMNTTLEEDLNGVGKRMKIVGPFIVMDKKNGNGRIYGNEECIPAVEKYIQEWVLPKRAMGELNHPGIPRVNPERACIKIEELTLDRDNMVYMGKAKVLKTGLGPIVQGLLEEDIRLGVSSRMTGSVDAYSKRTRNLRVVTAGDVVTDPSASDAMVEYLMEHREYLTDQNGNFERAFEDFRGDLDKKGLKTVDSILSKFLEDVALKL